MEAVTFSDSEVWTFMVQLGIIFGAILIGNIIRTRVPGLKKLFIPSALLGGLVVFILKSAVPAIDNAVDSSVMQIITYHCLGLGFASMALKTAKSRKLVSTAKVVESGALMGSAYMIQALTGLVISIAAYFIFKGFYAAGLILPMGFGQSTGSALSWGSKFETSYGFTGGSSYGLAVASIGFVMGSVIGVIYLNVVSRKKHVVIRRGNEEYREENTVIGTTGEIPDAESVDKLSIQICLVFLAYICSYGFMLLLGAVPVSAISDLAWGLNFLWALLFGMIIKVIMSALKKKNIIQRYYVNNYLMDRIGGLMFDIMITAGVIAIDFESVYANVGLLVVTCVAGTLVSFLYVRKATSYTYKGYELESFLTNFGTVTGTVSTGMILLREIDPEYSTPAASNIVLQNIPSIAFIAPLLLTMSFAASSLTNTIIMFCVYAVLLIGYNIFLFRRRIFKKRYAGRAEEVWKESDGQE